MGASNANLLFFLGLYPDGFAFGPALEYDSWHDPENIRANSIETSFQSYRFVLLFKGITELSYRECASQVSAMTGQNISAMGIWNVIQALGEMVCEDEAELIEAYEKGQVKEKREL